MALLGIRRLFALGLVVAILAPRPAQAACDLPAPAILWSYPADGDTDVPTNAMIWIITSRGRQPQRIALDGQPLDVSARDFSFVPPEPMAPNAQHEVAIAPPVGPVLRIRFRTGAGPAERVAPDKPIVHWVSPQTGRSLSPRCQGILDAMDCFTNEDTHLVVAAEGAPLLWLVERLGQEGQPPRIQPWPGECGLPEVFAPAAEGRLCGRGVRLHAVAPTGLRRMSDPFCFGEYLRTGPDLPPGSRRDGGIPQSDAGSSEDAQWTPILIGGANEETPQGDQGGPAGAVPARRSVSRPVAACSLTSGTDTRSGRLWLASVALGLFAAYRSPRRRSSRLSR